MLSVTDIGDASLMALVGANIGKVFLVSIKHENEGEEPFFI